MRKTPIKHLVKTHQRNGKIVKSYTRGKGTRFQKVWNTRARPTIKKTPKGYTVNFVFPNNSKETVKVIATDYHRAIDEALEEKTNKATPIEIHVVDPSLGEIINWAGKRAVDYSVKALQKGRELHSQVHYDYETKKLVNEAYSPNRTIRTLARAKLRGKYPEVWDVMDISKS